MEKEEPELILDDNEELTQILMEDFSGNIKRIKSSSHKEDNINDETLPYEFNIKKNKTETLLEQPVEQPNNEAHINFEQAPDDELMLASSEYPHDEEPEQPEEEFEILSELRSLNIAEEEPFMAEEFNETYLDMPMKSKAFSASLQEPAVNEKIIDGDILDQICWAKREHIAHQKEIISESKLREMTYSVSPPRGFTTAINSKIAVGQNALIAEIKKASPSRGIIRADFEPSMIAKSYEAGGATCISVLTDIPYFQGRDEYLNMVRRAISLPVLRKDFILDTYQVVESRALGADCILLIMAALNDEQAIALEAEAIGLGLDVLAEVHNEEELARALKLKTMLIGINNRDLKTFKIDLGITERLAPLVPFPRTVICESGINTYDDILRMNNANVRSFLVGESLMVQSDIKNATEKLLGNAL
jgi:indole-3-glycerol phosphate synthase